MTTREEQIEKAREIARLNRQWEAESPYLKHQNAEELGYERGLRDGLAMSAKDRDKMYAEV